MRVQAPHHEEQVWGRGQGFRSGLLLPEKPVSPKCRCPAGTLTRVRISGELLGWLECGVIRVRLASEAAKHMGWPRAGVDHRREALKGRRNIISFLHL